MNRLHLIVTGDVQGIGFRSWARFKARELQLTGWVKNREDGTVEIVAEGSRDKLEKLIEACKRGPEVAWVKNVEVEWQKATGEFVDFEVIY